MAVCSVSPVLALEPVFRLEQPGRRPGNPVSQWRVHCVPRTPGAV